MMSTPSRSQPVMDCHTYSLMRIPNAQRTIKDQRISDFRHFLCRMNWSANPVATQKYIRMAKFEEDQSQRPEKNPISNSSMSPIQTTPQIPICPTLLHQSWQRHHRSPPDLLPVGRLHWPHMFCVCFRAGHRQFPHPPT